MVYGKEVNVILVYIYIYIPRRVSSALLKEYSTTWLNLKARSPILLGSIKIQFLILEHGLS